MVDRRPKLLLDAAQAAELAMMFVGDTTLDAFSADAQRRSATERQLEILGEAFARLAKEEPALFERLPLARARPSRCATGSRTATTRWTTGSCTPRCSPTCHHGPEPFAPG
jgi:hypothetical protein